MNTKRKEKFGDLLLDIAKYIITAVILTSFFQGINEWKWYTYVLTIAAVSVTIWVGLQLYQDDKGIKNKKGK